MQRSTLFAISPIDGRYHKKLSALSALFSEFGLFHHRVIVEIRWLEMLANSSLIPGMPPLSSEAKLILEEVIDKFSEEDALTIKTIEDETNHDVKAIEYFIKKSIGGNAELARISEFVHFGCTSEDINNLAYGLMLKKARGKCIIPALEQLIKQLQQYALHYADLAMLARTHGQPATPTTLGKEFANFTARLQEQTDKLVALPLKGKLNGATGNYNAMTIACPHVDWELMSRDFVKGLGLEWNAYTTQIEPHDYMADMFATLQHINTILLGFNKDIWSYIKDDYFKLKHKPNEVGSSTMPHKINPIDFENSEGNLGVSNSLLSHMCEKLPISRLQRDLSDSTVLRNIGVALAHSVLAWLSLETGMAKLVPNPEVIAADLDKHWEVLAEAIQTVMRLYGIPEPYEKLKAFTRGKAIDKEMLKEFVTGLELPEEVKSRLLALTPANYTGYANKLACRI
jgi:adenylosuccinate lyase